MKHVSPATLQTVTLEDRVAAGIAFLDQRAEAGWRERIMLAENMIIGDKECCAMALAVGVNYVDACSRLGLNPSGPEVVAYGFQMVAEYFIEQDADGDIICEEWIAEMEGLSAVWRLALSHSVIPRYDQAA